MNSNYNEPEEKITETKTPWYKSPVAAVAAAFVIILGGTGIFLAGALRNTPEKNSSDDAKITINTATSVSSEISEEAEDEETETTAAPEETVTEAPADNSAAVLQEEAETAENAENEKTAAEKAEEERVKLQEAKEKADAEATLRNNNESGDGITIGTGNMEMTNELAYEFMVALETIDRLDCVSNAISYNIENSFTDENGHTWAECTEPYFRSADEINTYLRMYLTSNYRNSVYSEIIDSAQPKYKEIDGTLYADISRPKYAQVMYENYSPSIEKQNDDMYTVFADSRLTEFVAIVIIRDGDGNWKIDSVSYSH